MYLLPKPPGIHSYSHDLRVIIHSAREEFWELPLNVGDERDLFSFVSKESCLLDSLDITNRQTNLRKHGTKKSK